MKGRVEMGKQYKQRCECPEPLLMGGNKVCSKCNRKVSRKRLKRRAHGSDIVPRKRIAMSPPSGGSGELHVSP